MGAERQGPRRPQREDSLSGPSEDDGVPRSRGPTTCDASGITAKGWVQGPRLYLRKYSVPPQEVGRWLEWEIRVEYVREFLLRRFPCRVRISDVKVL